MRFKLLLLTLLTICNLLNSQTYQEYNPNDERFKILALKKSKLVYDNEEKNYNEAKELFAKKMISSKELDEKKSNYEGSKLNYQQYLLSVIFEKPHISVISAVKSKDNLGSVTVDLALKNTSGGSFDFESSLSEDAEIFKQAALRNVYVSLKDDDGSIISQPYEQHIPVFKQNGSQHIRFQLLKEVEALTVCTVYGDKADNKKIFLKRQDNAGNLTITPDLYTQESEIGQAAIYNLKLEFFGSKQTRLNFKVSGLPQFCTYEIVNKATTTVVSAASFDQNNFAQQFQLKINLPENSKMVQPGQKLDFVFTATDDKNSSAGEIALELVAAGRSAVELLLENNYLSVEEKSLIQLNRVKIKNSGQQNIISPEIESFLPPNWEIKISPDKTAEVQAGKTAEVMIELIPPANLEPGIYSARLKIKGTSGSRQLSSTEQELKIEITGKSRPWLTVLLVLLVLGIAAGVVYGLIKVARN